MKRVKKTTLKNVSNVNLIDETDNIYVPSEYISMYPSAFRNQKYGYLSRLTTESNVTGAIRRIVDNESFIISYDTKEVKSNKREIDEVEFIVNGYYFKVTDFYNNVLQKFTEGEDKKIYATILLKEFKMEDSSTSEVDKVLININSSEHTSLDWESIPETGNFQFEGIKFTAVSPSSTPDNTSSLLICTKEGDNWVIHTPSLLKMHSTRIANGEKGEVSIKDKFTTSDLEVVDNFICKYNKDKKLLWYVDNNGNTIHTNNYSGKEKLPIQVKGVNDAQISWNGKQWEADYSVRDGVRIYKLSKTLDFTSSSYTYTYNKILADYKEDGKVLTLGFPLSITRYSVTLDTYGFTIDNSSVSEGVDFNAHVIPHEHCTLPEDLEIKIGDKILKKGTDYIYSLDITYPSLIIYWRSITSIKQGDKLVIKGRAVYDGLIFESNKSSPVGESVSYTYCGSIDTSKLKYSIDGGKNWLHWPQDTRISFSYNQQLWVWNENKTLSRDINKYFHFNTTGELKLSGNIMSMINYASLSEGCFFGLFEGCRSIIDASNLSLPSKTLARLCYHGLFYKCDYLIIAPELPATTLASRCYHEMFYNCTSLTKTPELPATTLAEWCYANMFEGCTSLIEVSELPATTLAESCYMYMFYGCTSLKVNEDGTTGTKIFTCPNTTGIYGSVDGMFTDTRGTFTGTPSSGHTYNWYTEAKEHILKQSLVNLIHDAPGEFNTGEQITINLSIDEKEHPHFAVPIKEDIKFTPAIDFNYEVNLDGTKGTITFTAPAFDLTIEAKSEYGGLKLTAINDSTIYFNIASRTTPMIKYTDSIDIEYSFDGLTWQQWGYNPWEVIKGIVSLPIEIKKGNHIYVRNNKNYLIISSFIGDFRFHFYSKDDNTKITASGNVMSMIKYEQSSGWVLNNMFEGCTSLVDISNLRLPATKLNRGCYAEMFNGCTSLVTVPPNLLPATTLAESCYMSMFQGCIALETTPTLSATKLELQCYAHMFYNCTSLTTAPELPATTLAESCYSCMFYNCANLKVNEDGTTGTKIFTYSDATAVSPVFSMFEGTGGSFKGTPTVGHTYNWYK